jgi:hypothetical protein
MKNTVIQVHEDEGVRTGLVVTVGPKWLGVIWPDSSGMAINKVDRKAGRFHELDYPVKKARRKLRKMAACFGITKAARRLLREPQS